MGLIESILTFVRGSGNGRTGSAATPTPSSGPTPLKSRPSPIREEAAEDDEDLDAFLDQSEADPMKDSLLAKYKAVSKMSSDDWDAIADRIVVIHAEMSLTDAIDKLALWAKEDEIPSAAARDTLDGFAKANAAVKPEHRFKKIGSLAEPVRADIYLTP